MADESAEIRQQIARLGSQYDGLPESKVAERKAIEDQVATLRDRLDALDPPARVPDPPSPGRDLVAEAKDDIAAVAGIVGATAPSPPPDGSVAEDLEFVTEASGEVTDPKDEARIETIRKKDDEERPARQKKAKDDRAWRAAAAERERIEHPAEAALTAAGAAGHDISDEARIEAGNKDKITHKMTIEGHNCTTGYPAQIVRQIGIVGADALVCGSYLLPSLVACELPEASSGTFRNEG